MIKKIILAGVIGANSLAYASVNVVVSILPQQTFVEKIGGDKINVTTMVRPGSDPHSYEPKPSQMIAISKAQLYFPIKIEFENTWLPKFKEQNTQMQVVEMTNDVEFLKMPAHGSETEENGLPFEWAGAFNLKKGEYHWSFAKVDGKYADPAMRFLMIKTETPNKNLITSYEEEAKILFDDKHSIIAQHNEPIDINKKTYKLTFDQTQDQTVFKLTIKEDGTYLFFTEHMPFEFEDKEHFLKDLARNDIEPTKTVPESNGHHHHHGGLDPHTWTSPNNVKIMAKNIYNALVKVDTQNSAYYQKNYETFLEEITQTDKKIKETLSNIPEGSKFMVFHPSWGYFAKEYELTQLTIEVEGKEPKPKSLRKIIDKARQENIKAVFTQQEFSDKSAKALARELGIKVIKETPLAKEWSDNLLKMAQAIANTN